MFVYPMYIYVPLFWLWQCIEGRKTITVISVTNITINYVILTLVRLPGLNVRGATKWVLA